MHPKSSYRTNLPDLMRIGFFLFLLLCVSTVAVAGEWWKIRIDTIPLEAEVVKTPQEQQMGLGNRFSLPSGQGMLFLYDHPGVRIFWMKRMNFPIDIIWIRKGRIVFIQENIPPPEPDTPDTQLERYGQGVLADMVLEVPAGFVRNHGISFNSNLFIANRN